MTPSAWPAGRIVILATGSACSESTATRAWPVSWTATECFSSGKRQLDPSRRPRMIRSLASSMSAGLDDVAVVAHGDDRRLVDEVGEVGAREAGGPARDGVEVDVGAEVLLVRVHLQDGGTLGLVGKRDLDLAVEAPWAQERRVEHLGAVGGSHDDDAGRGVEAVHLGQELVEGLLTLVVGNDRAAPLLADGVDLVDEDDRRCPLVRVREQVRTREAPTPTNISTKLEPVRAKKGTSASPATARAMRVFPLPGGPDHEHAPGPDRARLGVAGGVLQEVDDLAHLAFGALVTGDVGKARSRAAARRRPSPWSRRYP